VFTTPNLSIVFMKIGDRVSFLIAYTSCILLLVKKCLIGCLSFMSIRVATVVVFSSLISTSVGKHALPSAFSVLQIAKTPYASFTPLLCIGSNVFSAGFMAITYIDFP
jgi:hypothetical protein